jgi:galactose mutarotase-like enzyme
VHVEEVSIRNSDVEAKVAPARGALISALKIGNKQVLYLDRATFEDETKNVRRNSCVVSLCRQAGKWQA